MNPLVLALILLPAIGLVAGIGLGVAAHFMKVEENEKAKAIRACLPGANCGACGFSGCSGYAEALSESPNLKTNLCTVGGDEVAKAISEILGTKAEKTVPRRAVVRCAGTLDARKNKAIYEGISTCRAALMVQNGGNGCAYGCLGFGDCARACDNDAITVLAITTPSPCATALRWSRRQNASPAANAPPLAPRALSRSFPRANTPMRRV